MSNPKVIVFTGGPCGGKSTVLPMAKQWLENHGYTVAILSEAATEVIQGGFAPFSPAWSSSLAFQGHLLNYQIDREHAYKRMLFDLKSHKSVLLCDRGALDSMAFIGREAYLDMLRDEEISLPSLRDRYTAIIHLMSAARGAADFYTLANNSARSETPEQAAALDIRIETAWLGHPHFFMATNKTNFSDKVRSVFSALSRMLHVPEPLEIERKFLVYQWQLPIDFVKVDIKQDYLIPNNEEPERRVRKRTLDGASSYFYTSKVQTAEAGVRIEREKQIDLGQYEKLLKERNPRCATIKKRRFCFVYGGKHFEVDVFPDITGPNGLALTILEVELNDIDEPIDIPPTWKVEDVTGLKEYSNAELAQRHA